MYIYIYILENKRQNCIILVSFTFEQLFLINVDDTIGTEIYGGMLPKSLETKPPFHVAEPRMMDLTHTLLP
jgi:hypothetical protein